MEREPTLLFRRAASAVREQLLSIVPDQHHHRYVVSTKEACRRVAQDCAPKLCKAPDDLQLATNALAEFAESMLSIDAVEGAALLASHFPDCPTTLTIEVLTPLRREDPATEATVKAVTQAEATLSQRFSPLLPTGLRFINSARKPLEVLEPRLRDRWKQDPQTDFLALAVFRR